MRHQRQRYQLSRSPAHRKSLLMNLSKEVIEHERIQTTEAKAKAVKPELEKLITLAKRGDLHARRQAPPRDRQRLGRKGLLPSGTRASPAKPLPSGRGPGHGQQHWTAFPKACT